MPINADRLEAIADAPFVTDVALLVREIYAQRALLAEIRPWIGDLDTLDRVDAAIRGEVP